MPLFAGWPRVGGGPQSQTLVEMTIKPAKVTVRDAGELPLGGSRYIDDSRRHGAGPTRGSFPSNPVESVHDLGGGPAHRAVDVGDDPQPAYGAFDGVPVRVRAVNDRNRPPGAPCLVNDAHIDLRCQHEP